MREGWAETTVGGIASVVNGVYLAKKDYVDGGEYEVQGAGGIMGHHDAASVDQPVTVIGRIGTVGKPRFFPNGCWINNNALGFVADTAAVLPGFLFLLLQTVDWDSIANRTAQPYLKKTDLPKLPILLPPLAEQKRIVDLIAAADRTVDAAKDAFESASALLVALGNSQWAAGVERRPLAEIGTTSTGKTPATKKREYWDGGTVPFVTPGDFPDGTIAIEGRTERFVTQQGADEAGRQLSQGAVVQVCIGATIGKVAVTGVPCITNQQVNAVDGLGSEDAHYLAALLRAPEAQGAVKARSGQTAVPIVNKSSWQSVEVPWPDTDTRTAIGAAVMAASAVAEAARDTADRLSALRSSLLNDLLSGEHEIPESYDAMLAVAS